ncbi:MAG: endolytic transglycosylase MltG [Rikenellaceae bacterium]
MAKLFFRLLIIGAVVAALLYHQFYGGGVRDDLSIELNIKDIERLGAEKIVDSLVLPHIKNKIAFNIYADHLNLYGRGVIRGYYELSSKMSVVDVVRRLKLGMQTPKKITFNNIRTVEQLAGAIGGQIQADSLEILEAIDSPEWRDELGLSHQERISIFIPNTYEVWWSVEPNDLVARMVSEYQRFWTPERDAKREELGMSRAEVITLASIVVQESKVVGEYRRIAGVYINRLKRRMRLQADPTVIFGIGDFTINRVLKAHLRYDSPYNTYIYRGLPPGAIALPTISAIDGVLNYENHTYLYFCARPEMDGEHNFATTYEDHLINARAYQAELNARAKGE